MELDQKYNAFDAFRPHFDALARVAYFKLVLKSVSPLKTTLHKIYRCAVWVMVVVYNLQHFLKLIQVRHSSDQIVDILFILLTTLNTMGKQLAFNLKSRRVDEIIALINGPIFAAKNPYHVTVMKENASVMRNLLRLYIISIFTCGTLWTIYPLVNRAMGKEVLFTGYFPYDTSYSPVFEITVAYMSILVTFQAYGHVTMDCTIVAFFSQAKVQLQMLRYNLEHIVDNVDDFAEETNEVQDVRLLSKNLHIYKDFRKAKEIIQNRFIRCIRHYERILWLVKEVEDIFKEALFFQFLILAWVICMTVYKIVGISLLSAEFVSMAMYLSCMLAQLFLYCYYGTQVSYESEFVNLSAYCGAWPSLSPSFRRQMLIMMTKCSQRITPRVAYIIPISIETYIRILRASYTLFTFLDRK